MNRLFVDELVSVGVVESGDNPDAEVVLFKRSFTQDQRRALAEKGQALPDGSFPIVNKADLQNAVNAWGRASNKAAAKAHIIRRARALAATEMLPQDWSVTKVKATAESPSDQTGAGMDFSVIEDEAIRKDVEEAFAALHTEIDGLKAQVEEAAPPVDPIEKADDEVRELIEKERARGDQLEAELADIRAGEFVAKAEPLVMIVGAPAEAGPMLQGIAQKAPDEYAKLEPMLTAAAAKFRESGLFKVLGHEGEAETDPIAKRNAWVEKNRQDGETVVQANSRYWEENPDALEESRS